MHFTSHLGQDQWVAEVFKHKCSGYFLDFGAFDGLMTSNTFYLERYLNWSGICVEPNPLYYASLCAVRNSVSVNVALWPESRQSVEFIDAHGLSCFAKFRDGDCNAKLRRSIARQSIQVDTLNPTELLQRFSAPALIEYMSLDVEGAEPVVLSSLDLKKYKIALMTIEHSHHAEKRATITEHLAELGYEVVERLCDDYFFNRQILDDITDGAFLDPIQAAKNVARTYKVYDR